MPPAEAWASPSSHPWERSASRTAPGEWSASGVTFTRRRVRPAALRGSAPVLGVTPGLAAGGLAAAAGSGEQISAAAAAGS